MRLKKHWVITNDSGCPSIVGVLKQLLQNASAGRIISAYFPQGHGQGLTLWVLLSRLWNHDDGDMLDREV
jgi:hypothetical protein